MWVEDDWDYKIVFFFERARLKTGKGKVSQNWAIKIYVGKKVCSYRETILLGNEVGKVFKVVFLRLQSNYAAHWFMDKKCKNIVFSLSWNGFYIWKCWTCWQSEKIETLKMPD